MPIWIVDLNNMSLKRTPQPTGERHLDPVWIGDDIYYLSERDFANNIWKFSTKTGEEKQITFHKKFDQPPELQEERVQSSTRTDFLENG